MSLPQLYFNLEQEEVRARLHQAKAKLAGKALILAHHYQRDEVWEMADFKGDSLELAKIGAREKDIPFIIFCGVHFMAETADILKSPSQTILLPDLSAGCALADSAEFSTVQQVWEKLSEFNLAHDFVPVTYVNSAADIKAFCGEKNGYVCTSANAEAILRKAYTEKSKVFFLPDKNLGHFTGLKLGLKETDIFKWDRNAEPEAGEIMHKKLITWNGFCPVHTPFTAEDIQLLRKQNPEIKVIVHPECDPEVTANADLVGSTSFIIERITQAPAGSAWAIGTESHLVNRLRKQHPDKNIRMLSLKPTCLCSQMDRISPEHLLWTLEELVKGNVVNVVSVPEEIKKMAQKALSGMIEE